MSRYCMYNSFSFRAPLPHWRSRAFRRCSSAAKSSSPRGRAALRRTGGTEPLDEVLRARSHDDCGSLCRDVLPAKDLYRGDPALSVGDRAEVEEHDAIFGAIDDAVDALGQPGPVLASEKARKDAVLQRPAVRLRQPVHRAQPL